MIRVARYLYTLHHDEVVRHPFFTGLHFDGEWLSIAPDGSARIRKGYAWDGCSPKFVVRNRIFGTPDGPLMPNGLPMTYRASVWHDAAYQHADELPPVLGRREIDLVFRALLRQSGYGLVKAELYYLAVRAAGWRHH